MTNERKMGVDLAAEGTRDETVLHVSEPKAAVAAAPRAETKEEEQERVKRKLASAWKHWRVQPGQMFRGMDGVTYLPGHVFEENDPALKDHPNIAAQCAPTDEKPKKKEKPV